MPVHQNASTSISPGHACALRYSIVVLTRGRTCLVSPAMAEIFMRTARRVLARNESELVVLLHEAGVELVFVNSTTPIVVVDRSQAGIVSLWASPAPECEANEVLAGAVQKGEALIVDDLRERILMAVYPLFIHHPVHDLSWAQVHDVSGVTVEELQREFGSLELLVGDCLKIREREWTIGLIRAGVRERATAADDKLLAIFDVFDEWFHRDDYEACTFINVLLEMGKDHPLGRASASHLRYIRSILAGLAVEAGLREPEQFALSWHLLMKGAIISAAEGDTGAAKRAKEMGTDLIARHRVRDDMCGLGATQQSRFATAPVDSAEAGASGFLIDPRWACS